MLLTVYADSGLKMAWPVKCPLEKAMNLSGIVLLNQRLQVLTIPHSPAFWTASFESCDCKCNLVYLCLRYSHLSIWSLSGSAKSNAALPWCIMSSPCQPCCNCAILCVTAIHSSIYIVSARPFEAKTYSHVQARLSNKSHLARQLGL